MRRSRFTVTTGTLFWCDTSRSNIRTHFSDKTHRPVLLIDRAGDYAIVYPCSRFRAVGGTAEWVDDLFGAQDTWVVFSSGLYYVPLADLQFPGVPCTEWPHWKAVYRRVIEADKQELWAAEADRFRSYASLSRAQSTHFSTKLDQRISPEALKKLQERLISIPGREPPKSPPPPQKIVPKIAADEFLLAVNSILPYVNIDKDAVEEDADLDADANRSAAGRGAGKRKGRRQ